jgi:hypothetical protein
MRASSSDGLPVLARPPLVGVVLTTSLGRTPLLEDVERGTLIVSDGEIEPDSDGVEVSVCDVEVCGAVVGTVSVGAGELEDGEFDVLVSVGKIELDGDGLAVPVSDGEPEPDGLLDGEVAVSLDVGVTAEPCVGGGYSANAD